MTNTAKSLKSSRQHPRGKSLGWAALDRKQQQKQSGEPDIESDPYPPMSSGSSSSLKIVGSQFPQVKTFSSVVKPTLNFHPEISTSQQSSLSVCTSKKLDERTALEKINISPLDRLKNVHGWADNDLIQDILAATDNDEEQASNALKAMTPYSNEEKDTADIDTNMLPLNIDEKHVMPNRVSEISDGKAKLESTPSAPQEPEWDEDDIYLILRKEAIRMMRAASQHSRAANNAFLRGDHFSAHQHSVKAHEEWAAANELNAKAAKKILLIRNINNDMWKLDLHGLHASEAMSALQEHLHRIERESTTEHSGSSAEASRLVGMIQRTSSSEVAASELESGAQNEQMVLQQRQRVLHVITGKGNHSHGEAALPTAIKGFLIENGYRFDDMRPGVFLVRPKFRRS